MKLLTPKEIKKEKRKELVKELVLAEKVKSVSNQRRKQLNSVKTHYMTQTEVLEKDFGVFLEEHNTKKSSFTNEIATLEVQKKQAMKPVTHLLKEAKEKNERADQRQQELDSRHDTQEIRDTKLGERERKTIVKEGELSEQVNSLDNRQDVIKEKEKEIFQGGNILSEQQQTHDLLVVTQKEEIVNEHAIIKVDKRNLNNRELSLDKREEKVNQEWLLIADQRRTLERAFARIKK